MSPLLAAFLRSTVLPAGLFGSALLLTGRVREPWRARAQATLMALAFALGAHLLLFRLAWPPSDVSESVTYASFALALFVWMAPTGVAARYALRATVTVAGLSLLLWHIWPSLQGTANLRNLVAFACLSLALWSITDDAPVGPVSLLALPFVSALATAVLLLVSSSAAFAQLVGVLAGLLGAALAVSVLTPGYVSRAALVPFASVFVGWLLTIGHFYLDVNPWRLIAACGPFALMRLRPYLPLPKHPALEALVLASLAAAPLAWFLKNVIETSGPLY